MNIIIENKKQHSRRIAPLLSTSVLVILVSVLQPKSVHATCTTTGNETECTDEVRSSNASNMPLFAAAAQIVEEKQLRVESSTLTTTGQGSPVIFTGSVDTSISTALVGDSVLTSRGNDAPAIESLGSQNIGSTTTVIHGSTIQTEGENSVAFISAAGAEDRAVHTVNFSESNFLTSGEESAGIVVRSGAMDGSAFDFSLTSSDVITKGDFSVGVNVDARSGSNSAISVRIGTSDVADAVSISTSGAYSTGLSTGSQADTNSVSNMVITNTTISTTGLGASGLYAIVGADNESNIVLKLDANKITTAGDTADGIVLFSAFGNLLDSFSSKSTVIIENTTVTTTGRLADALVIGRGLVFDTALQTNGATEVSITVDNFGNFLATGEGGRGIQNNGTILQGANGLEFGAGVAQRISNNGVIQGSGTVAVTFDQTTDTDDLFEIQSGAQTMGKVLAGGGEDTLVLGGQDNGVFDRNLVGTQYLDFERFVKEDNSTFTLTNANDLQWSIVGGELAIAESNLQTGETQFHVSTGITRGLDATVRQVVQSTTGKLTVNDGVSISTGADGVAVVQVQGDGIVNVNGEISTSGNAANGVEIVDKGLITSSGTIATAGENSNGIYGTGTAGVSINYTGTGSNIIKTNGTASNGIFAESSGDATINASGKITVNGAEAAGIQAVNSGSGTANITSSATITNDGNSGHGISTEVQSGSGTATVTNSGAITVNGTESDAISAIAGGDGDVEIANVGNLSATGSLSSGIYAEAEGSGSTSVELSNGTVNGTIGVVFKAKSANKAVLKIGESATVKTADTNAVMGGESDDTVEHRGQIEGNVQLGSGDDTFVLFPTATLAGAVNFEAGTDIFAVDGAAGTTGNIALIASGTAIANNFEVFEKRGEGTWIFDGDDLTSTAPNIPARILEGTAIINADLTTIDVVNHSSGRLEGVGGVKSLINNGVFAPGGNNVAGAFSVFGPLTLDSQGELNMDIFSDGTSDLITVNGNTTLAGNLIVNGVNYPSGFPTNLDYTIISSSDTAGAISGNFDTVSDNLPDVDVSVVVNPAADTNADMILDTVANVVVSYDRGGDESDKSIIPNSLQAGASAGRAFNNMLHTRSKQLVRSADRPDSNSTSSNGYRLKTDAAPTASNDLPFVYDSWASIFGSWDKVDSTSIASAYTARLGGLSGGFGSTHILDGGQIVYLGGAIAYSVTDVDSGLSESEIETAHFAAYGSLKQDPWLFSGALAYAHQSYEIDRLIPVVVGTPLSASAKSDGNLLTASMEIAYNVAHHIDGLDEQTRISPFVSLDYAHVNLDGYTESGAGILNQSVASHSYHQTWGAIGFEYTTKVVMDNDVVLTPSLTVAYEHAFDDLEASVGSSIAGLANGTFQTKGASLGENAVRLGVGLDIDFAENLSANFQYSGAFSSDSRSHTASASFTYKF